MKIKFLGTSAGWPLPRLGCICAICSSNDPRDTRTRTQLLINNTLLLDIGIDTYQHLKTLTTLAKTHYAAITHEHPDHTFGLWDLGHIYNSETIEVFIHQSTYKKIRKLFFYKEYKVNLVEEGEKQKLSDLILSLLKVTHTDSSFGVLLEESNKKLFYAPDFKSFPKETKLALEGVDLLILDGSELKINTPTHQSITENIKLAKEINAKETYFVHLGHRILPHRKLEKYVEKYGNFRVPHDGLEINL